jgi:hypothetical protein
VASIRVLIVLLAAVFVPAHALAGQPVRTPRDSPLVVNGIIRPAPGGASAPATPEPRTTAVPGTTVCTPRIIPDSGDRPMWVQGDWCGTGGQAVWVPGHWVW